MVIVRRVALATLFSAVIGLGQVSVANAQSEVSLSGGITLSATVLPNRTIVVDNSGIITQIFSNTDENVGPNVHIGTASGPETALTPVIEASYHAIEVGVTGENDGIITLEYQPLSEFLPGYEVYIMTPGSGDETLPPYLIYPARR